MKKIICILFFLACILPSFSQEQKGFVVLQNSGRQPVSNVSIIVEGGVPTTSDVKGKFAVELPQHSLGQQIKVGSIKHKDYVVLNEREIANWVYAPNKQYRIEMCSLKEKAKRIEKYYAIGLESYRKEYEKSVSILEKELNNNKIKKEEFISQQKILVTTLANQQKELSKYCDLIASINIDYLDSLETQIMQYVDSGRIDKAIELYEEAHLQEKYERTIYEHDNLNLDLETAIPQLERYFNLLMLKGGEEQVAKAERALRVIADCDSTHEKRNREYIDFLMGHGKNDQALIYIDRIRRNINNPYQEIEYLLMMAEIANNRQEEEKCDALFDDIQVIFDTIPDGTKEYVAMKIIYYGKVADLFARRGYYNDAYRLLNKRRTLFLEYFNDTEKRRNTLLEDYIKMKDCAIELQSLEKLDTINAYLKDYNDDEYKLSNAIQTSLFYINKKEHAKALSILSTIENDVNKIIQSDVSGSIRLALTFYANISAAHIGIGKLENKQIADSILTRACQLVDNLSEVQKIENGNLLELIYANKMGLLIGNNKYDEVIALMDECALYRQSTAKDIILGYNWLYSLLCAERDAEIENYMKLIHVATVVYPEAQYSIIASYLYHQLLNSTGRTSFAKKFELEKLQKAQNVESKSMIAAVLINLADTYFREENNDSVAYYLNQANQIVQELECTEDSVYTIFHRSAYMYSMLNNGDFDTAKQIFCDSISKTNLPLVDNIRIKLCLYSQEKDSLENISYAIESLKEDFPIQYNMLMMEKELLHAMTSERDSDFISANNHFQQALDACKPLVERNKFRYRFWESYIYYKIAGISRKIGDNEKIWSSFQLAVLCHYLWNLDAENKKYYACNKNSLTILYKEELDTFSANFKLENGLVEFLLDNAVSLVFALFDKDVDTAIEVLYDICTEDVPTTGGTLYKELLPDKIKQLARQSGDEDIIEFSNKLIEVINEF